MAQDVLKEEGRTRPGFCPWLGQLLTLQKKIYQAQGRGVCDEAGLLAAERSCSPCSTKGGLQGTGHRGLG